MALSNNMFYILFSYIWKTKQFWGINGVWTAKQPSVMLLLDIIWLQKWRELFMLNFLMVDSNAEQKKVNNFLP